MAILPHLQLRILVIVASSFVRTPHMVGGSYTEYH
jgi:hypothetical protein